MLSKYTFQGQLFIKNETFLKLHLYNSHCSLTNLMFILLYVCVINGFIKGDSYNNLSQTLFMIVCMYY